MPLSLPSQLTGPGDSVPVSYPVVTFDWDLNFNPDSSGDNLEPEEWNEALNSVFVGVGDSESLVVAHGASSGRPLLFSFQTGLQEIEYYSEDDEEYLTDDFRVVQGWAYSPTLDRIEQVTVAASEPGSEVSEIPLSVAPAPGQNLLIYRPDDLGATMLSFAVVATSDAVWATALGWE